MAKHSTLGTPPSPLVIRIARLAWIVPAALLLLSLNQAKVAYDLRQTLNLGVEAVAEVLEYRLEERVDIPFGYVSLKVPLPEGGEIIQEKMSLPYTLMGRIRHQETLNVRVFPEADQQIVILEVVETQWKIAAIQALICFATFLMAGAGVFGWNRLIKRSQ